MQLETERLKTIPLTADLLELFLYDRAAFARLLQVRVPDEWPQPDFAEIMSVLTEDWRKHPHRQGWDALIVLKGEDVVIGDIGLKGGPDEKGLVDLGYSILPSYRNRGFATEIAAKVVEWAIRHPKIREVTAQCLEDNLPSIRVLEKLGMIRTGKVGPLITWTLPAEKWEPGQLAFRAKE
jgi:[ribosomal protein S5]-alanine N-acetyltransferase